LIEQSGLMKREKSKNANKTVLAKAKIEKAKKEECS
jgi:hypothetical protein